MTMGEKKNKTTSIESNSVDSLCVSICGTRDDCSIYYLSFGLAVYFLAVCCSDARSQSVSSAPTRKHRHTNTSLQETDWRKKRGKGSLQRPSPLAPLIKAGCALLLRVLTLQPPVGLPVWRARARARVPATLIADRGFFQCFPATTSSRTTSTTRIKTYFSLISLSTVEQEEGKKIHRFRDKSRNNWKSGR